MVIIGKFINDSLSLTSDAQLVFDEKFVELGMSVQCIFFSFLFFFFPI